MPETNQVCRCPIFPIRTPASAGYLNSNRGASFGTLMRAFDQRALPDILDRKWGLIEFIAADPPTTLPAGAIEELLYVLREDRERAVGLFERLMTGHPTLLSVFR